MPLCSCVRILNMSHFLMPSTSVLWYTVHQAGVHVDALAAWKSAIFSSAAVRWYTLRPKWRLQTNMGSPPQTVSLGGRVYQWTCHVASKSPHNHPWRCDNSCLSTVTDAYFLSTLCYRVHKWYHHQTQHGARSGETLVQHIVQYTRTVLCTCFPQETTTHGTQHSSSQQGESPFGPRGDNFCLSKATTSLPTRVITSRYGWHYSSFQPLPFSHSGYSEEEQIPNHQDLQTHSITLPDDVLHLQEEMNDAIVHLLTVRTSVNAHQRRLISESQITHCKNETKASETINGLETYYMAALHDTKAVYAAALRKVEATHTASTREVEATCTTTVKEAETARAVQTSKLWLTTWKPCELWKTRPSKRKDTVTNPFCGPVEWLFRPVPTKL